MNSFDGQGLDRQIDDILYCMDPELSRGDNIYESLIFYSHPAAGQDLSAGAVLKTLPNIVKNFDDYWAKRVNNLHKRSTFHDRIQKEKESVEEFYRELHELAETDNYGDRDDRIRDRFINRLKDEQLQDKLFFQTNLTLSKAFETAMQWEAIQDLLKDREGETQKSK